MKSASALAIFGLGALILGSGPASACNVGDVYCENGYRYVCKCWTATGCNYEPGGTCHHDGARPDLAGVRRLTNGPARHAALACSPAPAAPGQSCVAR